LSSPNYTSTLMHHGRPLHHLTSQHMQKTSMGGSFAGFPWRHVRQGGIEVTQSKVIKLETQLCKQRSGRESLVGTTSLWSTWAQSNKEACNTLEKYGDERSSRAPRLVSPGRPTSPFYSPLVLVFLR
jgi:hypothetical protein